MPERESRFLMKKLRLPARAKINLTLEVLSRRPDGYHEIRTVLQALELHDLITIEPGPEIAVLSLHPEVPGGPANLAYKAALALREKVGGEPGGARIFIEKRIPLAAGLAGGSADAAATLQGLNELWGLGLEREELLQVAARIGSDVPFCLDGITALATGRGEILHPLPPLPPLYVVLANPGFGVATSWAYAEFDRGVKAPGEETAGKISPSLALVEVLKKGRLSELGALLYNDLAGVVSRRYPLIAELKDRLKSAGALGVEMSGSGPTVFGLFQEESRARQAMEELRRLVPTVILTKTATTRV